MLFLSKLVKSGSRLLLRYDFNSVSSSRVENFGCFLMIEVQVVVILVVLSRGDKQVPELDARVVSQSLGDFWPVFFFDCLLL